ncbi:MAG: peptidylprolyl isomerase [Planctomycetota bacterium]|jgi:cyclophilin family peptidyl-prolyl cis-trans isomerase
MKAKQFYILAAVMLAIVCVSVVCFGAGSVKKAASSTGVKPVSVKAVSPFKTEMDNVSYVIGIQIGTNMKSQGIEINVKLLAQGLEDALTGKEPVINQAQQQSIMMAFQKKMMAKMQEKQGKKAVKKTGEGDTWKLKLKKPELMKFDSSKDYFWILETSKGIIRIKLMPDVAPMHVTSTIFLTKKGFYDGIIFHRVIPGFMAQGGCPLGTGRAGPGYKYAGEFKPNVKHDKPYLLSMANSGPGTDGSQFFLTFKATPWLDDKHTIFGEIVAGQDIMKKLEAAGSPSGKTKEKLLITRARIEEKKK